MKPLLLSVLHEKDLSKAGELFVVPDKEIVEYIDPALETIKYVFSSANYAQDQNCQSVVEICLARISSAIRETKSMDKWALKLVSLLDACLQFNLRPPIAITTSNPLNGNVGFGNVGNCLKDAPHAKIASDILSCLFLHYNIHSVMAESIPAAVKVLTKGNIELTRNTTSYLSLVGMQYPKLLAIHASQIIVSILNGNHSLCRVLPQIYTDNCDPVHNSLSSLLKSIGAYQPDEKLSIIQLCTLVANNKPEILVRDIALLQPYLKWLGHHRSARSPNGGHPGAVVSGMLGVLLSLISQGHVGSLVHLLPEIKRTVMVLPVEQMGAFPKVFGAIGKLNRSYAQEIVSFLMIQCHRSTDGAYLVTILKEIETICDTYPDVVRPFYGEISKLVTKAIPGNSILTGIKMRISDRCNNSIDDNNRSDPHNSSSLDIVGAGGGHHHRNPTPLLLSSDAGNSNSRFGGDVDGGPAGGAGEPSVVSISSSSMMSSGPQHQQHYADYVGGGSSSINSPPRSMINEEEEEEKEGHSIYSSSAAIISKPAATRHQYPSSSYNNVPSSPTNLSRTTTTDRRDHHSQFDGTTSGMSKFIVKSSNSSSNNQSPSKNGVHHTEPTITTVRKTPRNNNNNSSNLCRPKSRSYCNLMTSQKYLLSSSSSIGRQSSNSNATDKQRQFQQPSKTPDFPPPKYNSVVRKREPLSPPVVIRNSDGYVIVEPPPDYFHHHNNHHPPLIADRSSNNATEGMIRLRSSRPPDPYSSNQHQPAAAGDFSSSSSSILNQHARNLILTTHPNNRQSSAAATTNHHVTNRHQHQQHTTASSNTASSPQQPYQHHHFNRNSMFVLSPTTGEYQEVHYMNSKGRIKVSPPKPLLTAGGGGGSTASSNHQSILDGSVCIINNNSSSGAAGKQSENSPMLLPSSTNFSEISSIESSSPFIRPKTPKVNPTGSHVVTTFNPNRSITQRTGSGNTLTTVEELSMNPKGRGDCDDGDSATAATSIIDDKRRQQTIPGEESTAVISNLQPTQRGQSSLEQQLQLAIISSRNKRDAQTQSTATLDNLQPYNRDAVSKFCEKHLRKIQTYMVTLSTRCPIPCKCTVEQTTSSSKCRMRIHFSCQEKGDHCLHDESDKLYAFKSKLPHLWIQLMFLQLQASSGDVILGSESGGSVEELRKCWSCLPVSATKNRSFTALLTSMFPGPKEQSALLKELRDARYFDTFSFNNTGERQVWACFACNNPEKVRQFINRVGGSESLNPAPAKYLPYGSSNGGHNSLTAANHTNNNSGLPQQPLLAGELKEKKGRWKFLKRWQTKYFTLSGVTLSYKPTSPPDPLEFAQPSIDLKSIRSVRSVGRRGGGRGRGRTKGRPRAFEIFTQDDDNSYVLKASSGPEAEQWFQCLQIAVAHAQRQKYAPAASVLLVQEEEHQEEPQISSL